jgi:hypothetical protein
MHATILIKNTTQLPSSSLVLTLSSVPLASQTEERTAHLCLMNMTMSLTLDALVHSATPPTDKQQQ